MINSLNTALLIPTLNAGQQWSKTLESIKQQAYKPQKLFVVDSGSNDTTINIAKQFNFEVIKIAKTEFNHGATRQLLVDQVPESDIYIFLTQDAILGSHDSLLNIVKVFDDPEIGMAYGRQLPHKNAKTLESHARLYNYPDKANIRSFKDKDHLGFKVFFCSNSFAAYRRTALMAVGGFPSDSIMGEDAIVAARMLKAGFKKAYVADATVYHSHSYKLKEEFERYFDTRVFHEQNKWLIETYGKPIGEGIKFMKSELKYVVKNDLKAIFKSTFSLGAKWLGYKTGGLYKKMPLWLLKKLSMHKFYWK
ncbi:glycosyltransferase family 2 protein [Mucilaginibacter lappiensis]|uniref:Rhamnosyltransferase n=1 Tax=Mucilaginibacter lappiensis TaxID=354630 RepID=A0A841J8G9_9SPHI|nr:glycosyltransferase family 2 protein [Mucilaginibacter lappiensis]MBB6127050.1 rhamnosyltransferase [Mucilaginibacter lappiensis]